MTAANLPSRLTYGKRTYTVGLEDDGMLLSSTQVLHTLIDEGFQLVEVDGPVAVRLGTQFAGRLPFADGDLLPRQSFQKCLGEDAVPQGAALLGRLVAGGRTQHDQAVLRG